MCRQFFCLKTATDYVMLSFVADRSMRTVQRRQKHACRMPNLIEASA